MISAPIWLDVDIDPVVIVNIVLAGRHGHGGGGGPAGGLFGGG
jgi:hypothetical protein